MRSLVLALFVSSVLAAATLASSQHASPAASVAEARSVSDIAAAWKDSSRVWASLPEDVRREKAIRFHANIPFNTYARLCHDTGPNTEDDSNLSGLLRARFMLAPPTAAELATLISNHQARLACHKELIMFLSHSKDRISNEDGLILGDALMRLADHSAYPEGIRNQIEMAAAFCSTADSVLTRISAHTDSDSPDLRSLGFMMMAESRDPRASSAMVSLLHQWAEKPDLVPPRVLVVAGNRLGEAGYEPLRRIFDGLSDPTLRSAALQGLAATQDPRVCDLLIEAYGDRETGIVDNTSGIEDRDEKDRHFSLWHLARVFEPTTVRMLRGDDRAHRASALELLDRESRYGAAADPTAVRGALVWFSTSAGDDLAAARTQEILARFQMWDEQLLQKGR